MQNDIPLRELASQFHATHFIVSQVNPKPKPKPNPNLTLTIVSQVNPHLLPFLDEP